MTPVSPPAGALLAALAALSRAVTLVLRESNY